MTRKPTTWLGALALLALLALAVACGGPQDRAPFALKPVPLAEGEKLRVLATTTIVGDVVKEVGGGDIELTVLIPPGADPHTYEPTPQDLKALERAHVVFVNGVGLESALEPLLKSAAKSPIVEVSEGVALRRLAESPEKAGQPDPHVWFNPLNVITWARNVENALSALDPAHAESYRAGADRYAEELKQLDAWIEEQVSRIPPERRKLVTDHLAFGYFADRYGFEQVGAVFPGFSTGAEPSARELAELEESIRRLGVPAIFVSNTVNPALAERIARDTGVKVVPLYIGSLSGPEGPAPTYIEMMRYDVRAIVEAYTTAANP